MSNWEWGLFGARVRTKAKTIIVAPNFWGLHTCATLRCRSMWKYHKWSINYWKLKDLKGKKFEIRKVVQNNGLLLLLLSQWRGRRGLLFILEVSFKSIGLFHLIPPTLFSSFLLRIECAKVVENSSTLKRTQIHTHTRICLAYFCLNMTVCLPLQNRLSFRSSLWICGSCLPPFSSFTCVYLLLYSHEMWKME